MHDWKQTGGVDGEIDLLFSPPDFGGVYKSQSPAPRFHFLFLSIKNDKLYLLKPLARFRVPVCTFAGGEARVRGGSDLFYPLPLLGMNKRVINCVGVAAA